MLQPHPIVVKAATAGYLVALLVSVALAFYPEFTTGGDHETASHFFLYLNLILLIVVKMVADIRGTGLGKIPNTIGTRPTIFWPRWLFLRGVAVGFVAFFVSISGQIHGLIGPNGILPAVQVLDAARALEPDAGPASVHPGTLSDALMAIADCKHVVWQCMQAPSLLWLDAGAAGLNGLCWVGGTASVLALINFAPRLNLFVCWLCYLSFVSVARNFSSFQSDGLMLQTCLLACFLAPRGLRPGLGVRSPPSSTSVFMLRWLCFCLMFEAGTAKLLSGDAAWWSLTAMHDYYVNCPFPNWIGWFVQHLPERFHSATVLFTLVVEIVCPLLILCGRFPRFVAFCLWSTMQLGIIITANYTFLNYNAIIVSLLLLDDRWCASLWPRFRALPPLPPLPIGWVRRVAGHAFLGIMFYITALWFFASMRVEIGKLAPGVIAAFQSIDGVCGVQTQTDTETASVTIAIPCLGLEADVTDWVLKPLVVSRPFRSTNRFALFASMTHHRHHIVFEGSTDGGRTWREYRYKWQPQNPQTAPRFMAPHLPRFDWNIWFAQLGTYKRYNFVLQTAVRLIEARPEVLDLFAGNPFPASPPTRIRFTLYRYGFTAIDSLLSTGNWWDIEPIGYYAPVVYLDAQSQGYKLAVGKAWDGTW